MGVVQVFNAARMLAIENRAIISGAVQNGRLLLIQRDGTAVDAGVVRGDQGLPGVNAVANDTATAGYVGTASQTQAALDARYPKKADLIPFGVWQDYVPTYLNTPNLTSVSARYRLMGKSCRVQYRGTLSGGAPTGNYRISLPFPARSAHPVLRQGPIGMAIHTDSTGTVGSITGNVVLSIETGTWAMILSATPTVTNDFWNDTKPVAWASTDVIGFHCEYEIA